MDLVLIGLIAFTTSVVSGMLGLGGAVLLIPAYLYIPQMFGMTPMDVRSISGVTTVQVFAASMLGALLHGKKGMVDRQLVLIMGIPIAVASLTGAVLSAYVPGNVILGVFAAMAILGAILMILRKEAENVDSYRYSKPGAAGIATGVGLFGGMVGAPGAFLLSPLMMTVLRIPTRVTIGSTLGIVLLSAFAAGVGKVGTGQVPFLPAVAAVLGSLPGVALGALFSHRIQNRTLRWALAVLIGVVGVRMWYQVLG